MTVTLGTSDGWPAINFIDLQSKNSAFPMGPLSSEQAALLMSVSSIGALIGTFTVSSICRTIGFKRTIHFLALPIVVRITKLFCPQVKSK